jgi:lysine biosynthesis protein LysW
MIDKENDEEDIQVEECGICGGDIIIDGFCEEDDMVYCNDCEAEYLIRSLDPIRLKLLSDEEGEEDEDDFGDDYEE